MVTKDPIGRSWLILRWMAEQPVSTVGVRQIAKVHGMQPSTVSRLLNRLHEERIVRRDPYTGKYSLGLELIRMGMCADRHLNVRATARPHLRTLVETCGETAFLGIYDNLHHEMMRVEAVPSAHPLQYVVVMGRWTNVYAGASGLGIAAFLDERDREVVVKLAVEATRAGDRPIRADVLRQEMAEIRSSGYACTSGRRTVGAVGIAAPVFDASGAVVGDIVITIPESRFEPHMKERLATSVMKTAAAVTSDMGGTLGVRPA